MPLALCVAIVAGCGVMWLRSASVEDRVSLAIANRRLYLGSASHRFYIRGTLSGEERLRIDSHAPREAMTPAEPAQLWPAYQKELLARTVFVPYWVVMTPAALAGLLLARQTRGRAARASRSRRASHSGAGGGSSMRMARKSRSSKLRNVA